MVRKTKNAIEENISETDERKKTFEPTEELF